MGGVCKLVPCMKYMEYMYLLISSGLYRQLVEYSIICYIIMICVPLVCCMDGRVTRHAALKAYGVPRSSLNEIGKGKRGDDKGKGKKRAEKQGMRNGMKGNLNE